MNLAEIRQKYPQYDDLSDADLAKGLHAKHYSDIPFSDFAARIGLTAAREDWGAPDVKDGVYQVGGPVRPESINQLDIGKEYIAPVVEPAATLATGAVGELAGNIAGGTRSLAEPALAMIQGRFQDPLIGPKTRDRVASMLTTQPRSEGAKRILNRWAELLGPIEELRESARLGDEAREAGLPEAAQRNAEMIPEMVEATLAAPLAPIVGAIGRAIPNKLGGPTERPAPGEANVDKFGNVVSDMDDKTKIAMDLQNNPQRPSTAGWQIKGGEVVPHKMERAALKQGWTRETVSGLKAANPETKTRVRQMVDIAKRRIGEGITSKVDLRYTDPLGKSLFERYQFVKGANRSAGALLDRVAKDLGDQGLRVDVSGPLTWFDSKLNEFGIVVKPDGKVDFSNSSLPKSDRGLITENIQQIRRVVGKDVNNFYEAHKLKQILRRTGLSYKQTVAKSGASPDAQALFKGFSAKIDEVLDAASPTYDQQNIKFGETREVLDSLEKIAKDNLFLETGDRFLGKTARRITSNAVSRDAVLQMADDIQAVANKYGGDFKDDIRAQIFIANEMDDVIETAAKTSLKGDVGAEVMRGAERSTAGNLARATEWASDKINRRSPQKALNTLWSLAR